MEKDHFTLWQEHKELAQKMNPLKGKLFDPIGPAIDKKTKRFLRFKSLFWILRQDYKEHLLITRKIFKKPFTYCLPYISSFIKNRPYKRRGDTFFFNVDSEKEFLEKVKQKKSVLFVGFSYCEKPFECPSNRFSTECAYDIESPICKQCHLAKVQHFLGKKAIFLPITTSHELGKRLFTIKEKFPKKELLFLISTCELAIEMFSHFGNMLQMKGIAIKLHGRTCRTMESFEIAERGIKPGKTFLSKEGDEQYDQLLRSLTTRKVSL